MTTQHSSACCRIPPIVTHDYEPKGKYITLDGRKTYTSGPSDSRAGILIIYDIFGYMPQSVQGADILALSTNKKERSSSQGSSSSSSNDDDDEASSENKPNKKHKGYQIFMPDLLEAQYADPNWFPPTDDDKREKLFGFLQGPAEPRQTLAKIPGVMAALRKEYPKIERWGVVGYCWGAKLVTKLAAELDGSFVVGGMCHPSFLEAGDGTEVRIPVVVLASRDEDKDSVKGFRENLKVENVVETFDEQPHGFMAARADLNYEKAKADYERAYQTLLNFFHKYL